MKLSSIVRTIIKRWKRAGALSKFLDQAREATRLKHYSYRFEEFSIACFGQFGETSGPQQLGTVNGLDDDCAWVPSLPIAPIMLIAAVVPLNNHLEIET